MPVFLSSWPARHLRVQRSPEHVGPVAGPRRHPGRIAFFEIDRTPQENFDIVALSKLR